MKVLLSWLNDFAPFGKDVDGLCDTMASLGLPAESVSEVGRPIDGVIVAKVMRRAPHPNADRIGLVFVDNGDGEELQICCGAFNMQPGDLVPLAAIGTVMPDGRDIQRSKMRGEWSNGMLCSTKELGLGEDHEGIWILPPGLPLGSPVFAAAGIDHDVIIELDLTRNRPDCWGHVGVARDLAANLGLHFAPADVSDVVEVGPSDGLTAAIGDVERCGRFTARRITGVEICESPNWIASRLTRAGMRPINNVVDASNYVMLELNRPNHAYDEAKLGGGGFNIRRSRRGEQIVTLDGTTRLLDDDCLICDFDDMPIGIGGIMGGATTEVDANTSSIAFEQAWFDPVGISISVARLGLRSEASLRFERGCDPFDDDYAAKRFVQLLRQSCPGATLHASVVATGSLPNRSPVTVRVARVNHILGVALGADRMKGLLDPIGYDTTILNPEELVVNIPSWRYDSSTEIDVIEEIARHHGYDKIAATVPDSPHAGALSERQRDRRLLRQVLVGLGACEVMPNPFLAPGDLARAGVDADGISITNPLVAEESVLRTSLLPGVLKTLAYNASHRRRELVVFEIGHTYRRPFVGQLLPIEHEWLAVAVAGREAPAAVAVLREVAACVALELRVRSADIGGLHPTRAAAVLVANDIVGAVGEVDPRVLESFSIGERVAWLELDLDALLARPHGERVYVPVLRTPSNDIDLALVAPASLPVDEVEHALRDAGGELLVSLELFDVYRGPGIASDARSLTFALRLQADDRTLNDREVAEVRARCIAAAESLGANLR